MNAEIIAVGTEILLGDIVNTNAQFLASELANLGVDVYYQSVVGDNVGRLKDTIFNAFSRADLVITTGGLGPTEDDLTKETGAEYFNLPLSIDKRALEQIEYFFSAMGRKMTDNNIKQAMVPEGAFVLYNENGTAPGIIIEKDNKIMVLLPGPPKELKPMFLNQVKPFLSKKQDATFVSRVLRVAGIGESAMETEIKDIINKQQNPTIAPYAKPNEAFLRITAKAKSVEEANELIEPVAMEIYERLGKNIYAEGENATIQEAVAEILIKKNLTIAVSESCTGGMLCSRLVDYSGISKVLLEGVVTYSNEAKIRRLGVKEETLNNYGAVSEQTAAEMAEGIAKSSGADIGISTTGIAGPCGGSEEKPVGLVYIGIYIGGEVFTKSIRIIGNRERVRERACYAALNWLRLKLI